MSPQQTCLPIVTTIVLAALAFPEVCSTGSQLGYAEEAATSEVAPLALQDRIELAEIRLAIRQQEVAVAKAERRLLAPEGELSEAAQRLYDNALQNVHTVEAEAARMKRLREIGNVSQREALQTESRYHQAKAELGALEVKLAISGAKLVVHDAKTELLELHVKLAEAKLNQLKRQQKP